MDELRQKIQDTYKRWRPISKSSGGVVGPVAYELGLDFVDATLIRWVHYLTEASKTRKITHNGKKFAWIHYPYFLKRYPMTGVTHSKVIGRHITRLVGLGVLDRHIDKSEMRTMVFLSLTEMARSFLTIKLDAQDDLKDLAKAWVLYWDEKEKPAPVTPIREVKSSAKIPKTGEHEGTFSANIDIFADPVPEFSYYDTFKRFIDWTTKNTRFKVNLFGKDGKPLKGTMKLQDMYLSLLKGTFVEKYKPVSQKFDFSEIGVVTETEMQKVITGAPDYIDQLPTLFQHFSTKRSELLESVSRIRNYSPPEKHSEMPDKHDKQFNTFLEYSSACSRLNWKDEKLLKAAWALHKWYIKNKDDLPKSGASHGLGEYGSAIANFLVRRPNWTVAPKDFEIDSPFWKQFALYMLKARGFKISPDESIYRKETERQDAKERLYEPRPYEYDPANVPDDPLYKDEW